MLKDREDLSKRSTDELIGVLRKYRDISVIEIAVILAELKLREIDGQTHS